MFLTRSCESLKRIGIRFLSQTYGGDKRDRTADPLLAKQVLSQLSYTPISLGLKTLRALKIKQRLLAMISSDLTLDVKSLFFK